MADLENQVHRVWNPDVRPLVAEAWRCYSAGAFRASIALTWVAVCADVTEKIITLADDGDGDAKEFRQTIERAREQGLSSKGVTTMQGVERTLLSAAVALELIDAIAERELSRLREDRHLCVHPSLRHLGDTYAPRQETARAHLAIALDSLLTLPPTQGRRVMDHFQNHVADPLFTYSPAHIVAAFHDRVRDTARRAIVDLAVKHAFLELSGPDTVAPSVLADRMAGCLSAFATRDRELVKTALAKAVDRLRTQETEALLRAVCRVGAIEVFWTVVDEPLGERISAQLAALPISKDREPLSPVVRPLLALVAQPAARERLPQLQDQFDRLTVHHRASVMACSPSKYFVARVPSVLSEARGWRAAEEYTRTVVIPHGPFLTADLLRATLQAWEENPQCRQAGDMLNLAVDLYRATQHLRPSDHPIWLDFIARVRTREEEYSPYRYTELEAAIMHPGSPTGWLPVAGTADVAMT